MLPVDGASVSVMTAAGSHSTLSSSGELATRLEQVQFDLGEGPHWSALRSGEPVLVDDTRTDDGRRWPMFAHAIAELGVGSLFSFPLRVGAATVGVVDLHRTRPGALTPTQTDLASALARGAADEALRWAAADAEAEGREQFGVGLRREVHQATGMASVQLGVSVTDAFAWLRARAYATGQTLDEVARDVVAGRISARDVGGEA
ncbi:hypothetical protein CVS47_02575 [Microbacterium lemovicicum]|uniref:ANTAR domain-containing protein n=2 Tax=Microbacterium lemovicicum TaxID=1072463 RepID=A0A3S9WCX3_9MICO|nr:hypothetical protein CVS47_02575 [Microbacterium lemovicicum]